MGPILRWLKEAGNTLLRFGKTWGLLFLTLTHTYIPATGHSWAFRGHSGQGGGQGGHGNGTERIRREGKEVGGPRGWAASMQLGSVPYRLRACCLCRAGQEAGPGMPGPYPVTPETPTSLSWKQGWARLLTDSCWTKGWRGEGDGEDGKDSHWKL